MQFLIKFFDWMFVIGLILMFGRILTAVFILINVPFTTFFTDYTVISFGILIVGLIGQQIMKSKNK